ncbi:MAG: SDR family NAD(P)-dependent oxidoreductase [Burkholderiaceae bacterium]|jgi:short-subunit dehydrogenase|nr:SDR family NAD(P)-dependent oxidoreductase [Burkholderiales bacterium]MCE2645461.1 SDR family NAD(P)-dependent oxidoreductase [Burkholderiaceae bacterium]
MTSAPTAVVTARRNEGPAAPAVPQPGLLGPLNPPLATYAGRRVWLIGASYGIGAALARELLGRGAQVALSARKRELLEQVAAGHAAARVQPLDITDHASVLAARDALLQTWGGIDLVLVVAGTHTEMRAQDFDIARARQLLEVNLHGVLNCVDAVLPPLLAQGTGGIAIVSSVAGYIGLPRALIYGASKAALINFTESLYGDLRPRGIGVYLVNPGFVDTPLTQKNDFEMPALMKAEDAARVTLDEIAAGRFEIHFPKRFTRALKLLRVLPYRWQLWAVRRFTGQ